MFSEQKKFILAYKIKIHDKTIYTHTVQSQGMQIYRKEQKAFFCHLSKQDLDEEGFKDIIVGKQTVGAITEKAVSKY